MHEKPHAAWGTRSLGIQTPRCRADTDTDAEAVTMATAATATRGGADGSDDARIDGTKSGTVDKQVTMKNAKWTHGREEEDGAYLRRKVWLLEREVSRLRETVER